jgi:sugar/nucleoside kinase (ribokinase family)
VPDLQEDGGAGVVDGAHHVGHRQHALAGVDQGHAGGCAALLVQASASLDDEADAMTRVGDDDFAYVSAASGSEPAPSSTGAR